MAIHVQICNNTPLSEILETPLIIELNACRPSHDFRGKILTSAFPSCTKFWVERGGGGGGGGEGGGGGGGGEDILSIKCMCKFASQH